MDKILPLYEMRINAQMDSDLEVSAISLVDVPATEKMWQAFKSTPQLMQFAEINEDQKIIVGAAMIPDLFIYRNDPERGEYNVVFSKDTVRCIAEKFYAKGFQGNANIMHDAGQAVAGVNYFLSWFKDDAKGMVGLTGDYPDGTWFVGAKVNNDAVWAKVKAGEIKGFSVEGLFEFEISNAAPTEDESLFEKIKNILNEISD